MKKLMIALGLSLAFSATSAMADDNFQALNNMPEAAITSLTNQQLEAVEGTYYFPSIDFCYGCANVATVGQTNFNVHGYADQTNNAGVYQSIN